MDLGDLPHRPDAPREALGVMGRGAQDPCWTRGWTSSGDSDLTQSEDDSPG